MMTIKRTRLTLAAMLLSATACTLVGCGPYKVTDPASGRVFYTKSIDQSKDGGYVEFKDAKSQAEITLQSSEVQKITKQEFEQATGIK